VFRNSILYHRMWYVKRRSARSVHISFKILSIFFILSLVFIYFNRMLYPAVMDISELRARELAAEAVNDAVRSKLPEGTGYEELVLINRDKAERVLSLQINYAKLNGLSTEISEKIQERLNSLRSQDISVPIGVLLGSTVFSVEGPELHIKVLPTGRVQTEFLSQFYEVDSNRTKHCIFLRVRTSIGITAPFMKERIEIENSIPIAETILVRTVKR